jgi:hypothetical protein
VTASGTVTGTYVIQWKVTFFQTGVGVDFTGTVATIAGNNRDQAALATGVDVWVNGGGTVAFSFASPLSLVGMRYDYTGTTGLSTLQAETITVSASGTVTGTYETQMDIEPIDVEVLVSTHDEIKVKLTYQSYALGPISSGVQVAELLGPPTPMTPIVVLVTSPVNLPSSGSTGYYMIDYTPASPLAPGSYQVCFFIFDEMPSEPGGGHPYMYEVFVPITIT